MANPTDQAPAGEEAGPPPPRVVRAAAHAQAAGLQQAYGAFILHTQDCATCRGTGIDCPDAATLKAAWREARGAA